MRRISWLDMLCWGTVGGVVGWSRARFVSKAFSRPNIWRILKCSVLILLAIQVDAVADRRQ